MNQKYLTSGVVFIKVGKENKLGTYAMKRVAAGAQLPTPWLFEHAKAYEIEI